MIIVLVTAVPCLSLSSADLSQSVGFPVFNVGFIDCNILSTTASGMTAVSVNALAVHGDVLHALLVLLLSDW